MNRFAVSAVRGWIGVLCAAVLAIPPGGCGDRDDGPAASKPSKARRVKTGFQERSITLAGEKHRYSVYVPEAYDPSAARPCILFLHGAGECGDDGEKPTRVGLGPQIRAEPAAWPAIVIFPQKPTHKIEWWECEDLVLAILTAVRRDYRIDEDRIALTGLSQGGHGTWMIGARHPDIWSCLAPICGYGRPKTIASRVATLPVWAFHGESDRVVPVRETIDVVAAIREAQTEAPAIEPVRMTLYPGVDHNSWEPAYRDAELRAWLLGQRRSARTAEDTGVKSDE